MIGKKIKELRKENGIKQKDIATALDISPQAVSLWENDNSDPDLENLKKLAQFFKVSIDEIMDFHED